MSPLSYRIGKKGQLNLPGITYASKKAAEELLLKDAETHHCFFRQSGFHNHLGHHILAAYDLGTPPGHLQKIYEDEARIQRPRILEEKDKNIVVDKDNWVQYLGNQSAYGAFVKFFSNEIDASGVNGTFENYVFGEDASKAGVDMLARVISGAVHPLIQIGYGAEFGNDTLIATGLAQAAVHGTPSKFHINKSPPSQSITLLELLAEIYASDVLKPVPYDPQPFISTRVKSVLDNGGAEEIERLCAQFHISDTITDAEIAQKTEELIWTAVLLTFGTGRKGRKPRIDFFLMHILTSSLFMRPLCALLKKQEHKAALIRTYIPVMVLFILARGRPRIDPELLMSYTAVPRPPSTSGDHPKPAETAVGNPADNADYNPWPALIEGVRYHSDSHVLKSMRTLIFATQHFGDTPPGGVIGAFRTQGGKQEETHVGMGKVDGTIFVRSAGVMMETLGWSGYGQKETDWDRSALGWDAAWESGD
ncbi:hypothetical protein BDZ97DRAFT_1754058 [Flammula alnicola]|nr:hypothetical protein BDZ97DRAFT_1754058 [Flammula alnicola]